MQTLKTFLHDLTHFVNDTTEQITEYPYQTRVDEYQIIIENFVMENSTMLMTLMGVFIFLVLNILMISQYLNGVKLEKMNRQLEKTNEIRGIENEKMKEKIEELENTIRVYRKLRTSQTGFIIVRGDASNRNFRELVKMVNGRYLDKVL